MEVVSKLGRDLKVHDVLLTWSGDKTITHFKPHPGLETQGKLHTARIACSGRWEMTVFDDEMHEVFA